MILEHLQKAVLTRHYESRVLVKAPAEDVFAYIDDHAHLSSHMSESSWMMGGGRVYTSVDNGNGQRVGSHIRMSGKAFGVKLFLDEVVTRREPPHTKVWETVGDLRLLVIGHYQIGFEVEPQEGKSLLRVYIDYDLPLKNIWLGRLFGATYAKWCVRQMLKSTRAYFAEGRYIMPAGSAIKMLRK